MVTDARYGVGILRRGVAGDRALDGRWRCGPRRGNVTIAAVRSRSCKAQSSQLPAVGFGAGGRPDAQTKKCSGIGNTGRVDLHWCLNDDRQSACGANCRRCKKVRGFDGQGVSSAHSRKSCGRQCERNGAIRAELLQQVRGKRGQRGRIRVKRRHSDSAGTASLSPLRWQVRSAPASLRDT
jgi:hypothetical protein